MARDHLTPEERAADALERSTEVLERICGHLERPEVERRRSLLAGKPAIEAHAEGCPALGGPCECGIRRKLDTCTKPPAGWLCSRPAGHDGPCAARWIEPVKDPEIMLQLHELEAILAQPHRPFRLSDNRTIVTFTNAARERAALIWAAYLREQG
jgi:hypothetical protein